MQWFTALKVLYEPIYGVEQGRGFPPKAGFVRFVITRSAPLSAVRNE
jgi:hypothetical protein